MFKINKEINITTFAPPLFFLDKLPFRLMSIYDDNSVRNGVKQVHGASFPPLTPFNYGKYMRFLQYESNRSCRNLLYPANGYFVLFLFFQRGLSKPRQPDGGSYLERRGFSPETGNYPGDWYQGNESSPSRMTLAALGIIGFGSFFALYNKKQNGFIVYW